MLFYVYIRWFAHFEIKSSLQKSITVFVYLHLCFSVRKEGAEDCKDLIDAFQACIKTLSEGS